MADFDPARYLAEKEAAVGKAAPTPAAFDPEKYLAEKESAQPALNPKDFQPGPEPTLTQKVGYKLQDAAGGLVGSLAEAAHDGVVAAHDRLHIPGLHGLAAGADRAVGTVIDAATGGPSSLRDVPNAFHKGYDETVAHYQPAVKTAEERSPVGSTLGKLGADLGVAAATAGAGKLVNAPKWLQALSAANGQGLVGSALNVSNSKSSDPAQLAKEAAVGYASGALPSAVGSAAGAVLSKPMRWASEGLENFARIRAVKAAGAIGSDVAKIGTKRAGEIGGRLLDEGLIPFGAKSEGIAERLGPAKGAAGEALDAVKGELEHLPGQRFSPMNAAKRIDAEIVTPLKQSVATEKDAERFHNIADQLRVKGAPGMPMYTIRGGEAEKRGFQEAYGNYGKLREALNPMAARENQLARIVKDESEHAIEQTAAANGQSPLAGEFKDAKKRYGDLKTANLWAQKGAARDAGNRFTSLTDNMTGGAALAGELAAGGPLALPKAAALAVGSKALRERGASAMAVMGRAAAQKALHLATNGTGVFGRYAGVLANATKKGQLESVHHLLMKNDPAYRKAVEEQP